MSRTDQIRKEILLQLYAVRPLALSAERMHRDCKKEGYDYSVTEINSEVWYLVDEGLAIQVKEPGATTMLYRIHSEGVRAYEQKYAA